MVQKIKQNRNSVSIKNIYIKNFRSIETASIDINQMNVFVGANDAGKSNILKALDWFFNKSHDQDANTALFMQNYSFYNKRGQNKAYEIVIKLTLDMPGFKTRQVIWEKIWRRTEVIEHFLDADGKELTDKFPRVRTAARRLKYKYVPAVKGRGVFAELLRDLYLTLSEDDNNEMLKVAKAFSDSVAEYTQSVSKDIQNLLNLTSKIAVPDNMEAIFGSLKFETFEKDIKIPLENRGDGIQARHIPSLLKFISEHDIKKNHRGKVSSNIIWGYEEPENGVELAQCFKMANEFLNLSADFQILITTHSPGFYSVGNDNKEFVNTYFVSKDEVNGSTFVSDEKKLDYRMGLMPLIAPYIKAKEKELIETQQELERVFKENDRLHFPAKILIVEDADKRTIKLWQDLLKDDSITVLPGGGCTSKVQEYWILGQQHRKPDYKPKVMKIIDRDGYTQEQIAYIKKQFSGKNYKFLILPVYEIENFAVISKNDFNDELYNKYSMSLVLKFIETATDHLNAMYETFHDSLFCDKGDYSRIATNMWQLATKNWKYHVNGKELCALLPNFDWRDHILNNCPDELNALIKDIKNYFNN